MCMLIAKPAGAVIPESILERVVAGNPHGHGLAWANVETGQIHVWKNTRKPKAWVQKAQELEAYPVLLHTRWATHGVRTDHNVHPFWLGRSKLAVLGHNGIIRTVPDHPTDSDTRVFVDRVLGHLPEWWWHNARMTAMVERTIGKGNKFAVLDRTGHFTIINEKAGEWHNGVWYSNTGYRGVDTRGWDCEYPDSFWDRSYGMRSNDPKDATSFEDVVDAEVLEPDNGIVGWYSETLWTAVCHVCADTYANILDEEDVTPIFEDDDEFLTAQCDACKRQLFARSTTIEG